MKEKMKKIEENLIILEEEENENIENFVNELEEFDFNNKTYNLYEF